MFRASSRPLLSYLLGILTLVDLSICVSASAQQPIPSPQPTYSASPVATSQPSTVTQSVVSFDRMALNRAFEGTRYEKQSYTGKQSVALRWLGYSVSRRINRQTVIAVTSSSEPLSVEIDEFTITPSILGKFSGGTETPPNDRLFTNQWYLQNLSQVLPNEDSVPQAGLRGFDIRAVDGWRTETGSANSIIAVIDSGVDYNHQDLASNIWSNVNDPVGDLNGDGTLDDDRDARDSRHYIDDHRGWDFSRCDLWQDSTLSVCLRTKQPSNNPIDRHIDGHGTHVAGIISARGNNGLGVAGVSWNSKIIPLKVGSRNGYIPDSELLEALQYAINLRRNHNVNIRVINISATWKSACTQALRGLLNDADALGILVVTAAGNESPQGQRISTSNPISPAICATENLITVASANHLGQLSRSSNYSSSLVHLAAPGSNMVSTLPNDAYGSYSGTSQAAALVSGAAALLFSIHPELSAISAKQIILDTTRKLDCARHQSLCDSTISGGVLDIAAMLNNGQNNNTPWRNPSNHRDTNNDGVVTPIDVLNIINALNGRTYPDGLLPAVKPINAPFYDVNGDGRVAPLDALIIINYLNDQSRRTLENTPGEMEVESRDLVAEGEYNTETLMLKGDLNNDQIVDYADRAILLENFGTVEEGNIVQAACDFDSNGIVDYRDYSVILNNFGKTLIPANSRVIQ